MGVFAFVFLVAGLSFAAEPDAKRGGELIRLVREECGSCHGLRLRGGLGPALLPATLAERSEELLVHVILNGRPGTAMPPWRPFLGENEARWIARRLKEGFPDARP